jgi:hypothetical protein
MTVPQKLAPIPRSIFIKRLLRNIAIALFIVIVSLAIGMCGYHYIEGVDWIDCYLEAAMILSGMGPVITLHTTAGKIFAGTYALYSGFTILLTVSIVLAPIVHRFLHKFHVSLEEESKKDKL